MPNIVFTAEGLLKVLANALWDETSVYREPWYIELFKSNTTIVYASVIADFTLADFTGYSHVAYTRADNIGVAVYTGDRVITQGTIHPTFTCTGGSPQTVYGWLAVGQTSGVVWFGQNFATPRVMTNGASEVLNPFLVQAKTLD